MRTRLPSFLATVPAVVLLAVALSAQGGRGLQVPPARDTGQEFTGTGVIAGNVSVGGGGTPVRRARVSLSAPELRGGRTILTDDQGLFVFVALPPGRYTINASKAGFVDMAYGATRPGRAGTPVQLADGQTLDRLSVSLPRGSVITGIVVDEHGDPAPGTQVRAMRYALQTGERRLQMAGQDQTDDRGIYRIFQLQPGDYIVSAVPRNRGVSEVQQFIAMEMANLQQAIQAQGGENVSVGVLAGGRGGGPAGLGARLAMLQQQLRNAEDTGGTTYAPVYYPGTTAAAGAQAIGLGAGEERGNVNFRLQLVSTTTVDGVVVTPSGMAPAGTTVALVARAAGGPEIPGLGDDTSRVGSDGRFSFNQVAPGEYVLQARANIRGTPAEGDASDRGGRGGRGRGPILQVLWASADLSVAGQPVPDIVLNLQEGMTVTGSVQFDGPGTPPEDLSSIRVTLAPRGGREFEIGNTPPAEVEANGSFRITGVAPGTYSINAGIGGGRGRFGGRGGGVIQTDLGSSAAWQLAAATHNGRDLLDFPVEIGPNQNLSDIVLRWTTRRQELSGTIQDSSGRPTSDYTIIVFPSQSEFWQPQARRISAARPGTDGRFSFGNLPPGDYRLTAVTDVEPGEWFDPAFLTQLQSASLPITLTEGEQKVQDIRVAGGGS